MTRVTFIQPDGRRETFEARIGDTLLDVALDNGVSGILGQCGGGCTCCTCHCWIPSPWAEQIPPPDRDELEMLEYAWGRAENSRLACQVEVNECLDLSEINIPEKQG